MPKTLPQRIVFTIVMATIMVYGMIVYNVALNTGGVTNATFGMALHEMPIVALQKNKKQIENRTEK